MASQFTYRQAVEQEIANSDEMMNVLEDMGHEIAADTVATSPMASGEPGRYGTPQVERGDGKVTVFTEGPFAHLDEWGSANNPPSAAMRRAAGAVGGKFIEA